MTQPLSYIQENWNETNFIAAIKHDRKMVFILYFSGSSFFSLKYSKLLSPDYPRAPIHCKNKRTLSDFQISL